ncbi:MAG: hypothetical protein D6798_19450 [Deltaproteobacteria bacterium]|nr:MAG: hypothetical protein D6798_19450 [Deltaproteobacteria bacterium]
MSRLTLSTLALIPLLAACGDKGGDDTGGAVDADLATAQDIWSEIAGYDSWNQTADWTGIQESADGTHGSHVQIWLNDLAYDTIEAGAGGDMPDGAILVKEGYSDSSGASLNAITAMKKISGFDSEHGDWFWVNYSEDGTVNMYGSESACYGCHESGQDYVRFTTW